MTQVEIEAEESEDEPFIIRPFDASRFNNARVVEIDDSDDSPVDDPPARVTDDPPARVTTKRLYSALEVFQDAQERGLHRRTEVTGKTHKAQTCLARLGSAHSGPSLFYVNLMKPLPWENEKEEESKPVRPVKRKKTRKEIEFDLWSDRTSGLIQDIKRSHLFTAERQRREEAERQAVRSSPGFLAWAARERQRRDAAER